MAGVMINMVHAIAQDCDANFDQSAAYVHLLTMNVNDMELFYMQASS